MIKFYNRNRSTSPRIKSRRAFLCSLWVYVDDSG